MRALTIHQPYAELIARGEKRVENRPQRFHYRGPLMIHAGKRSARWLELAQRDGIDVAEGELAFGAAIAVVEVVECLDYGAIRGRRRFTQGSLLDGADRDQWLLRCKHANGPWCLVLENVRRLPQPVPCLGRQSLWIPPRDVVAAIERQLG